MLSAAILLGAFRVNTVGSGITNVICLYIATPMRCECVSAMMSLSCQLFSVQIIHVYVSMLMGWGKLL